MSVLDELAAGRLDGVREVSLAGAGLETFPRDLARVRDTLEVLDLSGNALADLPAAIADFPRLRILFLSGNPLREVPRALTGCRSLSMAGFKTCRIEHWAEDALPPGIRWLILTDNRLERLPDSVGMLAGLRKFMLAGNHLSSLPETLSACRDLELLRLADNRLEHLPEWLFSLPRLAWLALSGNPAAPPVPTSAGPLLPELAWSDLEPGERLGSGASGEVFRVRPRAGGPGFPGDAPEMAAKVFRGARTSDGRPEDEIAANLAAGEHPAVLGARARVVAHPEGRDAILLDLLPPGSAPLGLPPSRESCVRDVFPPAPPAKIDRILSAARAAAAAAAHLHARGVHHGDLYAHNLQIPPSGTPRLGDFGAATLFDPADPLWAGRFAALESRALGCLFDDLLGLAERPDHDELVPLSTLRNDCLSEFPASRPSPSAASARLGA